MGASNSKPTLKSAVVVVPDANDEDAKVNNIRFSDSHVVSSPPFSPLQ